MGSGLPIGELAALGAAMLWAATSIIFTSAGKVSTPVAANTFKTVAATFLFALVILIRDGVPYGRGIAPVDILLLALSGVAGLAIGDSLLFRGFVMIGTRRAMLVFSLAPVVGAIGGYIFLHESLDIPAIAGMTVALCGVAIVISERRPVAADGITFPAVRAEDGVAPTRSGSIWKNRPLLTGVLLSVGAAVGQAVGALLAKPSLERVDTLAATQIRITASALALILFGMASGTLGKWTRLIVQGRLLPALAVGSIFGPFIGLFLMVLSIEKAPTGIALTLLSTSPIWLLPLGAWFQKDYPTKRETIGAFIAVAGMVLLLCRDLCRDPGIP